MCERADEGTQEGSGMKDSQSNLDDALTLALDVLPFTDGQEDTKEHEEPTALVRPLIRQVVRDPHTRKISHVVITDANGTQDVQTVHRDAHGYVTKTTTERRDTADPDRPRISKAADGSAMVWQNASVEPERTPCPGCAACEMRHANLRADWDEVVNTETARKQAEDARRVEYLTKRGLRP
jgi:hypothetical protein